MYSTQARRGSLRLLFNTRCGCKHLSLRPMFHCFRTIVFWQGWRFLLNEISTINMKKIFLIGAALLQVFACRKAQLQHTEAMNIPVPWNDSSAHHPKNAAFRELLEKYRLKRLPGISLLMNDKNG